MPSVATLKSVTPCEVMRLASPSLGEIDEEVASPYSTRRCWPDHTPLAGSATHGEPTMDGGAVHTEGVAAALPRRVPQDDAGLRSRIPCETIASGCDGVGKEHRGGKFGFVVSLRVWYSLVSSVAADTIQASESTARGRGKSGQGGVLVVLPFWSTLNYCDAQELRARWNKSSIETAKDQVRLRCAHRWALRLNVYFLVKVAQLIRARESRNSQSDSRARRVLAFEKMIRSEVMLRRAGEQTH